MEEKLSELSIDKLKKKLKDTKSLFGVFIGIMIVTLLISIFDYVSNKRFNPVLISTLSTVFFAIYIYQQMKKISAEIKLRGDNN